VQNPDNLLLLEQLGFVSISLRGWTLLIFGEDPGAQVPLAKMMSGASATNSAASLRVRSASSPGPEPRDLLQK
jgi:hypothetical protein